MYAFIEGQLAGKGGENLVLNVQGVGYQILCTAQALSMAPSIGEVYRVYTWLSVREDALELFGFASKEEKKLFLRLTSVSGIGPRTALNVLNAMPLNDLTLAILNADIVMLSRAPGIGKKTAQRIALELREQLSKDDFGDQFGFNNAQAQGYTQGAVADAVLALQGLGYTQAEATKAVSLAKQAGAEDKADDLIRAALRGMMKG